MNKIPQKLWHGGAPGLWKARALLPPSESEFEKTNAVITGSPPDGHWAAYRDDRVYATTDRQFAEVFALLYTQDPDRPGVGLVYEVELEDAILDPDLSTFGTSYEGTRGRILRPGTRIRSSAKHLAKRLAYYVEKGAEVNKVRQQEGQAALVGMDQATIAGTPVPLITAPDQATEPS